MSHPGTTLATATVALAWLTVAVPPTARRPAAPAVPPAAAALVADAPAVGYRRSWAVVVGINEYADPRLPRLDHAVNDAAAIRAALVDEFGYHPDAVRLLTDAAATRAAVADAVTRWLAARAAADDSALVFFAGHGLTGPGGTGYLATADSRAADLEQSSGWCSDCMGSCWEDEPCTPSGPTCGPGFMTPGKRASRRPRSPSGSTSRPRSSAA